jgi:hypothetical protein
MKALRRSLPRLAGAALLPLLQLGCGEESPTEAGGPLLPGEVRSFEVILDASRYLIGDTAFSGYGTPFDVQYYVVANGFDGALDAHMLTPFRMPAAIAVRDSAGVVRSDSAPIYFSGEILFRVDSILSSSKGPLETELLRIAEPFDAPSATWTHRTDTAGVALPWSVPGGTTGVRIDTSTWAASAGDTLRFAVDSATLAAWTDTADHGQGALLRLIDPGERIRVLEVFMRAEARSTIQPDTVVTVTIRPPDATFVFDPPIPATADGPVLGGITAWRTFLTLRPRLDTLRVPCPDQPGCTVSLRELTINHAAILLEPENPPPGFAPEDSIRPVARILLESADVPLIRSLLGGIAGQLLTPLPPGRFVGTETIELPLTDYLRTISADTVAATTVPPRIALLPALQGATFGFATFRPAPRLRLVVSVASELQLR